jgi:signal transduction histidine kinase
MDADSRGWHRFWPGAGIAVLLVAAAVVVRIVLLGSLGTHAPYVTFYPAVIIAALYGGLPGGIVATLLSAAATPVFWHEPEQGLFYVHDPLDWLAAFVFIVGGLMICWICDAMRRAKARAAKAEAQARFDGTLRFLVHCGDTASGEDFFKSLARYLAQGLDMDYVCIDRLRGGLLSAETVAIYYDGRFEDNISYTLKDTPCGDVVGKTICCFARDVRHLFPKDEVLQTMSAESYVGATLWSSQEKPIGLIAVIGRKELRDPQFAASVLQVVAVRAAGEMERREAEQALRESEAALQRANEDLQSINRQLFISNATLEARVKERTADLEQRTAQLRALASELTHAEQRERRRLARILHDHMQQLLVGAKFRVASLKRLKGQHPDAVASDLDSILNDCLEASRSLTAELSPPILHDAGLVPALEWLGQWVKQKHLLTVQVTAGEDIGEVRMRCAYCSRPYRNCSSMWSHSGVLTASVQVTRQDGNLEVVVADQGSGFNPLGVLVPTRSGGGFGLFNIRERLDFVGGRMEIESARGKGSLFRLIVASE